MIRRVHRVLGRLVPGPMGLSARRTIVGRRIVRGVHLETDVKALPLVISRNDVCWDIGANAGMYASRLSPLCARVEAFEPVPHNRLILGDVLRRLACVNVTVHDIAIAGRVGAARMRVPGGGYDGYYTAALAADGTLPVQTSTIDALIAGGLPEPALIKCDVEGAEGQVIDGALDLIARRHPIWVLETFEDDVFSRMLALGYVALVFERQGRFERVGERLASSRNYWFVPPALAGQLAG